MELKDWKPNRFICGDEFNRKTGFGLAVVANDRASNAENGVELLIKEIIALKIEIGKLKG